MGGGQSYEKPADVPSKYFGDFCKSLPRMDGKTVAVTGCTTGTGRICAKVCAQQGAKVVMLNRPSARADEALEALKKEVPGADISLVSCDLMSFDKVRQTGAELKKSLGSTGLDVLCNNAGIMATKDEATVDGCDTQMQTNHLSHFLLTAEVWPLLAKAAELRGEARIVNHSSGARKYAGKDGLQQQYFEKNGGNLGGDEMGAMPFSGPRWMRYAQTKLANLGFTLALRDRIPPESKVKALVAEPGLASTNLQVTSSADGGMGGTFTNYFMNWLSQSAEDGTMPLLSCCCAADVKSGDFYAPKSITGPAQLLPSQPEEARVPVEKRTMLWDTSLATTGAKFPF